MHVVHEYALGEGFPAGHVRFLAKLGVGLPQAPHKIAQQGQHHHADQRDKGPEGGFLGLPGRSSLRPSRRRPRPGRARRRLILRSGIGLIGVGRPILLAAVYHRRRIGRISRPLRGRLLVTSRTRHAFSSLLHKNIPDSILFYRGAKYLSMPPPRGRGNLFLHFICFSFFNRLTGGERWYIFLYGGAASPSPGFMKEE